MGQGWDCRSFDPVAYRRQILQDRVERSSIAFASVFLPDGDLIAVAYSSGHIR
jgi:hypothetical protein